MGVLSAEPLASLVVHLARKFSLRAFVETGTHKGRTARFAARLFPEVITIEISDAFRQEAIASSPETNIRFLLGDSSAILPEVVPGLAGPAFFWLDGHAGAGFYAKDDNCPLLAELGAIAASDHQHVIFIDDARAFLAPPPPPFRHECWPTLHQVLNAACRKFPYYCVVILDTIICVPQSMQPDIVHFCNAVRPKI